MVIPEKELTQFEIEKYWGLDRVRLVGCAKSKEQLVKALEARDRILQGK